MVALLTFKSSRTIYCKTWHKTVEELNLQQHHCEQNVSGEKQLCLAAMFSLYILQTIWKAEIFHRSITMHRYSNWDVMVTLPPHKFSSRPACHYTAHWQQKYSAAIIPDHANIGQLMTLDKEPQTNRILTSTTRSFCHWHCITVWNSEGQVYNVSTVLLLLAADAGCSIYNYGK